MLEWLKSKGFRQVIIINYSVNIFIKLLTYPYSNFAISFDDGVREDAIDNATSRVIG